MQHILELISDDRHVQHMASQFLHDKWPQMNEHTKVSMTNNRVVYIAEAPPMDLFNSTIRVAISGWKRLKSIAMYPTIAQLDNPEYRIAYSIRLQAAIVKAPIYLFWRIIGKLFKNPNWYNKGTELTINPYAKPQINRREIHLEHFGWRLQYPTYIREKNGQFKSDFADIVCGYDGATDTLWVYDK